MYGLGMPQAFIIGGTGQIGLAIAERLLAEGCEVLSGPDAIF